MSLQRIRRWWRPTDRGPVAELFRPTLCALESRITPVNDVQTVFASGTLTIKTVDQLGTAEILNNDNNQNFQIVANGAGNVIVRKTAATTINGGTVDVPFNGVSRIVIDLKNGDDNVILRGGVDIAGDLTVLGGDGNNQFNIDGDGATSRFKNVTFIGGDGVENITFLDGAIELTGSLNLKLGDGGCNLNIGFNTNDKVTIQGAMTIIGGDGGDNFSFTGDDFKVSGPTTIKGGNGNNFVQFQFDQSMVLEKPLTVTHGDGNDTFRVHGINKTSVFHGVTINHGAGNNLVVFDSTVSDKINGDLVINNKAGNDTLTIDPPDFFVTNSIKVNNGTGNSTSDISPSGKNHVTGKLQVVNAAGDDTIALGGSSINYGAISITNGNGDSTTTFTGAVINLASLSVNNADGDDVFQLTIASSFNATTGGITIKNGTGDSNTTIDALGTATVATAKALTIINGDGIDTTLIGDGSGKFNGLRDVTINNGAGNSSTTFNPDLLDIQGSLSVINGSGSDLFRIGDGDLTNFTISGNVKLSHGLGGSSSKLIPTIAGAVGGTMTFTSGDGNDTFLLNNMTVTGALTVATGFGNDTVEITNSTLNRVSIATSVGNDTVNIESTSNNSTTTKLQGDVSIDLGTGNDRVDFGLDVDDFVTTSKKVTINGGLGLEDRFNTNTAVNVLALPIVFLGIEIITP